MICQPWIIQFNWFIVTWAIRSICFHRPTSTSTSTLLLILTICLGSGVSVFFFSFSFGSTTFYVWRFIVNWFSIYSFWPFNLTFLFQLIFSFFLFFFHCHSSFDFSFITRIEWIMRIGKWMQFTIRRKSLGTDACRIRKRKKKFNGWKTMN